MPDAGQIGILNNLTHHRGRRTQSANVMLKCILLLSLKFGQTVLGVTQIAKGYPNTIPLSKTSFVTNSVKGEVGFPSRREARFVAILNEQISLYIRFLCSISTDLKPFITIDQNILNAHSERSERQEEYILHIDYTDTYIHYTHYISIYIYTFTQSIFI